MIDHDQLQALISGTWKLAVHKPVQAFEATLDITDLLAGTIQFSDSPENIPLTNPTYDVEQSKIQFSRPYPDGSEDFYYGSFDFSTQPPSMKGSGVEEPPPGYLGTQDLFSWSAQKLLPTEVDKGSFSTMDIRPWDKPHMGNAALIVFAQPLSAAPGLPLGLAELDIDGKAGIRIRTTTAFVTSENFQINIDSWGDTVLYSGGCNWIGIAPEDNDLQWGQFNTQEDHPWTQHQATTTRYITFPRPYAAPPSVVVWLNELDMSNSANWFIKAYATDISQMGFAIHIDTWANTILNSAGVTWIAHSAGSPNITSGTFNTQDVRPWNQPQLNNSNVIEFPHSFAITPRVTVALNSIAIDHASNLRISASASDVTPTGMTWHLDSWADTILYSAGGAYIAQHIPITLKVHPVGS
ncbi:MAG TPA: H-type lectin domain-containing protein [Ktedonobacteraceae bacterium]|nr:H-type lectin domain-containing protein [Ktedonobacteraceae bacterium]